MVLSQRWTKRLGIAAGVLTVLLVATLAAAGYLYHLSTTLPDIDKAPESIAAARTSIVYAADGTVIATWHGDEDRTIIGFSSMPRHLRDAVLAAEDERFYEHDGVDMDAVMSALLSRRGGTTITQQVIRMLIPEKDGGVTRKIREALMAYQLGAKTPKDKVLEAYLNMVYLGNGCYGVESASQSYFGKPAASLSLGEAAMLAGLIDAPSRYSPTQDEELATRRRDEILARMRDLAFITSEEEVEARRRPVKLAATDAGSVAPYFVESVKKDLISRLGSQKVYSGGLRVHTTLDPVLQRYAERAASEVLPLKSDPEVAIVTVDPRNGQVRALVGGRDFTDQQFDLAAQGKRQPGSAFKPFVLAAAFEKGVSPDRRFATAPITIKVKDGYWRVQNYENEFTSGALSLRKATEWSVNGVFARLIMIIGPEKVVDVAKRMGITSPLEPNPAIALGGLSKGVSPLEMASAYGTLATGGKHATPSLILRVDDDRGNTVYEPTSTVKQVISQKVAWRTSGMLRDVVESGTGIKARIPEWSAGKTGTSQNYRDAWFVGYTDDLSTAVWVGYRDSQKDMLDVHGIKVAGGSFPAMIWARYMKEASKAYSPALPSGAVESTGTAAGGGLVHVKICRESFKLANPRCTEVVETDLEKDLVPQEVCTQH